MEIKKYIKKPIPVNAVQFKHEYLHEIIENFLGSSYGGVSCLGKNKYYLYIKTLEGEMRAELDDYIIKGINDECYPCKKDIFEKIYKEIK
jgi:hypothetical protein